MTLSLRESRHSLKSDQRPLNHIVEKRPIWAALFLFTLFAIAGCEKPEQELGLGIQPDDDLLTAFQTDTTTIECFTIREDSLATDELSQSLLGNYFDPFTGITRTSIYTQLRLGTPDQDFGTNPVADSIVLAMRYTGESYGSLQDQFFEVYRLTEDLFIDSTYYSNDDFDFDFDNLVEIGQETQGFNLSDKLFFEEDSANPQLRLPLDLAFGEELMNAGDEIYDTNENWLEYFKGIYVRSSSGGGGVVNLDLVDSESAVRLYYHNDDDTLFYDYVINTSCARVNRFEHSFTGDLMPLNNFGEAPANQVGYVQAAAVCKTRIEFPHIDDYNEFEQRTINKAELIIPVFQEFDERLPFQSALFLLTEDEDGDAVGLPGQLSTVVDIGGSYNSSTNEYRFNISRWFQEYLNGNQAVNFVNLVSNNAGISVRRVGANGPEANPEDSSNNMRLILTFTD